MQAKDFMNSPDHRIRFKTASGIPMRLDPQIVNRREPHPGQLLSQRHRDLRLVGDTHSHSSWSRPPQYASLWTNEPWRAPVCTPLPSVASVDLEFQLPRRLGRAKRMTIAALLFMVCTLVAAAGVAWGHKLLG
jgi:hypothetical protein